MFNKKEFKNYTSELIKSSDSWFVKSHQSRIDCMCRAAINRSSYEFRCDEAQGQPSTYLAKEDRIIFIEKPDSSIGCWNGPLYKRIFNECNEIIDKAKRTYVPSEASEATN